MRLQSSSPKYNTNVINDFDLTISQKHAEIEQLLEEVTQHELELAQLENRLIKAIQDEQWLQQMRGCSTPSDSSSGRGGEPNFLARGHVHFKASIEIVP
jgi:hypothetical protein